MLERIAGEKLVAPQTVFDVELIERDSVKRLE
jgi:DNA-binding LacI/PurR family transcriptional regulator